MRAALRGKWFAQRLENLTGVGTPDVLWLSTGISGVLELKVVSRGNRVQFRAGQIPWMLNWVENGGRGHVVAWHKETIKVFEGRSIEDLDGGGITKTPHVECGVNWHRVLEVMKGVGDEAFERSSVRQPDRSHR